MADLNPVLAPKTVEADWQTVEAGWQTVEAGWSQSSKCAGGDSCCTVENPCGEWEGDCDSDEGCSGNLFCSRTCGPRVVSLGGDWDITDDCCLDPIKNPQVATLNKVRRAL